MPLTSASAPSSSASARASAATSDSGSGTASGSGSPASCSLQLGPLGQQRLAPLDGRLLLLEPAAGEGDERGIVGGDVVEHEADLGQRERAARDRRSRRRPSERSGSPPSASPAMRRGGPAGDDPRELGLGRREAGLGLDQLLGLVARPDRRPPTGRRRCRTGSRAGRAARCSAGPGRIDLAAAAAEAVAVVRLDDLGVGLLERLDQLGAGERAPLLTPRAAATRPAGLGHPQPAGHDDRVGVLLERARRSARRSHSVHRRRAP